MIQRTLLALLVAAGFAAAQQGAMEEKLRQQVADISRLMRESERLLLEISRVDRLVEAQRQVEEELKKLLPPEQNGQGGGGGEERAAERQQLQSKHAEISQRLEEMLRGERDRGQEAAQRIQELLDSLPRQQQMQQGGSKDPKDKAQEEREKRLREREEQDRKQHQPQSPRQQRDEQKDRRERDERKPRTPEEEQAAAAAKRVEAWIARLPPEDQERINRNDFSRVPIQYRKLVEEYTAQRAKREAEREPDRDR